MIAEWIEALRSGKYKQGTGRLRSNDDCYCCLGVLCEVAGIKAEHGCDGWEYEGRFGSLPPSLWSLFPDGVVKRLVDMNDIQLKGFNEIADYLDSCFAEREVPSGNQPA